MLAYWVVPWLIFLPFNDVFHPMSYVQLIHNRIGGVMVSVLALSAVDRGFMVWVKPKTIKLVSTKE